jgi:metal-responsive CopG/Arc/MetJ family transcriptional regulator
MTKTIHMTLDSDLLAQIDRAVKGMGTTRSAFARQALEDQLERLKESELERQHRRGYERFPVQEGEFSVEEDFQVWPD